MVLYVAVVAILNIGLGYALAVYMGHGRIPCRFGKTADYDSDYDYDSNYEYASDDAYSSGGYESDVEATASV
jgi:hypothetical protein